MRKTIIGGIFFIGGILLCCFSFLSIATFSTDFREYSNYLMNDFIIPILIGIFLTLLGFIILMVQFGKPEK